MSRVLQVLPAEGWRAVFADTDADTEGAFDALYYLRPLVCWSLVRYPPEDGFDDFEAVEGQVALDDVHSASSFPNFLCYIGPGEEVRQDWRDDLIAVIRREHERDKEVARTTSTP